MKCLPKLRVPCGQHSARAQAQPNLSISGLAARRPTHDTGYKKKTQLATLLLLPKHCTLPLNVFCHRNGILLVIYY